MPAKVGLNLNLLRWMTLGEWRARPSRVAVAVIAIAVGVALGLAVHIVNRSALDEFARAVRTVSGEADLQVRGAGPAGFAEALYPALARAPGVAAVSPVVELDATADGKAVTLLGTDVIRAAAVTPSLLGRAPGRDGAADPFDLDAVYLSASALRATGRAIGDKVMLTADGRAGAFTIAGGLAGAEDRPLAVIDISAAQWRFGQLGRLQRLDLRLDPGADRARVQADIARRLPAGVHLVTAQTEARRSDSLSRAYRVNLEMLAMVALLTGGFLVYSAQALSVARRRPQFALLRVLGALPRGLLAQLLVEGAILGVAGAALGVLLGVALARLALAVLGGDLGGGYFAGEQPALVFTPVAATIIFVLGVITALAGSLLPALEAGRAPAAVALKGAAGEASDPAWAPSARISLALIGGGGAAALAPPVGGLPLFGYLSIALLLAGGVGAMPWLARILLRPLRRIPDAAAPVALAIARLWGAPQQAAIALCGIVASTSLMVAMAVMVTSFRGSVDEWLVEVLPADLYLRVADASADSLDPATQARLAAAPGVAAVDFRKSVPLRLASDRPAVTLSARDVDKTHPDRSLPLLGRAAEVPIGATPVWISEPMSYAYRLRPGARLKLPIGRAEPVEVFVAGVSRDYANQLGTVIIDNRDYTRLSGDALRGEAAIALAENVDPGEGVEAVRRRLPPPLAARATFAQPQELRALALRIFDRSFAVTYALEAIAIAVGLAGVAATFSAQTLARRKEFGMLRHVGVRRREIAAMLAAEGALLGAVGAVVGLGLGLAMSQVLIHVVNPQSFHWTMETRLPWGLLALLAGALTVTSAATAVLAGRGALSATAVQAVREDW